MIQSVSFVEGEDVLFTERGNISIPRTNEMIEYDGKWYKVRQVYYSYQFLSRDDLFCQIEVNLIRSNFE